MKAIRVLLADHNQESREYLLKILERDKDIDVIGEATGGGEVIDIIAGAKPEIVLIDIAIPEKDSIDLAKAVTLNYPQTQVILLTDQEDLQLVKKAMQAGVREIFIRPYIIKEIIKQVKQIGMESRKKAEKNEGPAHSRSDAIPIPRQELAIKTSKVITVFGNKGGIGKSIIAANLAVAAAKKYPNRVALVDLDLQFGDISLMMNINPRKTIAELMQESGELTADLVDEYFYERCGAKVLSAPHKPELGELVTSFGVETVLKICRQMYSYTIIDTPTFLDENTLTALEMSDSILLLISLDIPTIKNIKKGLDILESIKMRPRTRLVLNRLPAVAVGLEPADVEQVLGMKISASIPSDFKITAPSVNRGTPFLITNPKAPISKSIVDLFNILEKEK